MNHTYIIYEAFEFATYFVKIDRMLKYISQRASYGCNKDIV